MCSIHIPLSEGELRILTSRDRGQKTEDINEWNHTTTANDPRNLCSNMKLYSFKLKLKLELEVLNPAATVDIIIIETEHRNDIHGCSYIQLAQVHFHDHYQSIRLLDLPQCPLSS